MTHIGQEFLGEDLDTRILCQKCLDRLNQHVKNCCGIRRLANSLQKPIFQQYKAFEVLLKKTMINHSTCEIHSDVFDFAIGKGKDMEIMCKYCLVDYINTISTPNQPEFKQLQSITVLDEAFFNENSVSQTINAEFEDLRNKLKQLTSNPQNEQQYITQIKNIKIENFPQEQLQWESTNNDDGERKRILDEINETIQGLEERIKILSAQGDDGHSFLHDSYIEQVHFWKKIWQDIHGKDEKDLKYGLKVNQLGAQCKKLQYL